jgi:hypothetical protein
MDVASAIVGLLGVGAQVYSTLNTFVSTCQDAPFIAHTTRDEVRDFHYALDRLRHYVWQREQITPLGRATTDTTQLRLTVASSMATFNQVEKILNRLLVQSKMDYIQRIRWALSDGDLAKLLTRIQQHKVTLILLLTIWSRFVIHAVPFVLPSLLYCDLGLRNIATHLRKLRPRMTS